MTQTNIKPAESMPNEQYLPPSAKRLKEARHSLWERARQVATAGFPWEYSHVVDRYFEERILETGAPNFTFALVAVGGYGRGKLCPGSDIDILLLFKRRIPAAAEQFVKDLLFPLWDLNLDLGHSVRTIGDCLSLAKKDFQVLASLLDARPLAGDAEVIETFREAFDRKVLQKKGRVFAASLREHNLMRARKYGDSTGLLEPELKNGLGGLRDGQQVFWLTRVMDSMGLPPVFLPEELSRLREDQAFVNRARTALHLSAKRKTDRLYFDLQPPTARMMGFAPQQATPDATGRSVEFFLSRLHQSMTHIKSMRETLFQEGFPQPLNTPPAITATNAKATASGISFKDHERVTATDVLDAFYDSAVTGLPLTWQARRLIRDNPGRFARQLIDRRETLDRLVNIFLCPQAGVACAGLLETRLLPAIFPEFSDVEHLIQFNDYHVHPVGRHTMETIRTLSEFINSGERWSAQMVSGLRRLDIPILGAFFHDLGKGESDHSRTGATIALETLQRYGLSKADAREVAFLVEHHLLLPEYATRRDLTDERVPTEVAELVVSRERLDMLYLLSVADSMATGPRAWNNWTRSLFTELYNKVRRLLEYGPLSKPEAARQLTTAREKVLALSKDLNPDFVKGALDAMPPRIFLAMDHTSIATHLPLVQRLWEAVAQDRIRKPSRIAGKGVNLIEARPAKVKGTYQLTIAALDQPGLFVTIAGALTLHGLNILAADLFTWKDGTAVDVFTVGEPPENLFADEVWARVSRSINYALVGKLDIASRLEDRRKSPLTKGRKGPKMAPIVKVDNDSSDFYSIIEIAATDKIGFLFDMARVLTKHGVSIHLAKITTIRGRAADIFHVRDTHGGKIVEEKRIEQITNDLLQAL
ncbi:[protein-PII] uridylyltransferase [Pseudodesulfovibrio profundus]|nr:[protein-PII] uridylyltransferase [Pseudodesulfovibrio profundus]